MESALRFSGSRAERRSCKQLRTSASHILRSHCRVSPQGLVLIASPCDRETDDLRKGPAMQKGHLPWGSAPFDEISSGNRSYAGLPRQHLPLTEFLALSVVSSYRYRVALFRATSVHRIWVFRAFPTRPAVFPLGNRYSLVIEASSNRRIGKPVSRFPPLHKTAPPKRGALSRAMSF
jgi:hypothetical protein